MMHDIEQMLIVAVAALSVVSVLLTLQLVRARKGFTEYFEQLKEGG